MIIGGNYKFQKFFSCDNYPMHNLKLKVSKFVVLGYFVLSLWLTTDPVAIIEEHMSCEHIFLT